MTINEYELELFYKETFTEDQIKDVFYNVSELFIHKYFIDGHISNEAYEKNILKIIVKLIFEVLTEKLDSSEIFVDNFATYIFKKNLKLIFLSISELLLRELAYSNKEVIEFLKYYSVDIVIVDGKRYKVPKLRTEDDLIWSVPSMMGIIKTYVKTQDYIKEIENDKDEIKNKISSLMINGLSPIEYNSMIEEKFKILNDKIEKNADKIDAIYDLNIILKDESEKKNLNIELELVKKQRLELREEKASLQKMKITQSLITQYQDLIKKIDAIQRETKAQYTILKQNEASFQSIKSVLAKALLSKKQPL